jgi:cellulose 1,4-beta-cellobiosidase
MVPCNEIDLLEANNAATAFTPHPCNITGPYAFSRTHCSSGDERYDGVCDKDGCDLYAYRLGSPNFYGPGKKNRRRHPILHQPQPPL